MEACPQGNYGEPLLLSSSLNSLALVRTRIHPPHTGYSDGAKQPWSEMTEVLSQNTTPYVSKNLPSLSHWKLVYRRDCWCILAGHWSSVASGGCFRRLCCQYFWSFPGELSGRTAHLLSKCGLSYAGLSRGSGRRGKMCVEFQMRQG